jgi:transcriptional regulator with XRE-family HTH domain
MEPLIYHMPFDIVMIVSAVRSERADELQELGIRLTEFRARAWMSQAQLAAVAGLGVATVARLELGAVLPHRDTIQKLARALGIKRDALVPAPERIWGRTAPPHHLAESTHDPLESSAGLVP